MSLYGSMRTGVSGMNAQANRLGTVAENIANANTTGYKRASTEFSSMILPSGGGNYNSGGVESQVRYSISQQGGTSYTTSATDLAINGGGFFIVKGASGENFLTRAGSFVENRDGNLVNTAGFKLMGYEYQDGVDPTVVVNGFDGLTEITLDGGAVSAKGSENGILKANLPSDVKVGWSKSTSLVAYDSQGISRLLDVVYTKVSAGRWTVDVQYQGTSIGLDGGVTPSSTIMFTGNLDPTAPIGTRVTSETIAYDDSGTNRFLRQEFTKTAAGYHMEVFEGATSLGSTVIVEDGFGSYVATPDFWTAANTIGGATLQPMLAYTAGITANPAASIVDGGSNGNSKFPELFFDENGELLNMTAFATTSPVYIGGAILYPISIDMDGSTQLGKDFEIVNGDIDGNAVSGVSGYEISDEGILYLKYDNGDLEPKYRIALANVQSPDKLLPQPGNVYSQGADSGVIVTGFAGSGAFGNIKSKALENSNVDIANELTVMIESQRNYTANSKVFQTASDLLDVLVNLKR